MQREYKPKRGYDLTTNNPTQYVYQGHFTYDELNFLWNLLDSNPSLGSSTWIKVHKKFKHAMKRLNWRNPSYLDDQLPTQSLTGARLGATPNFDPYCELTAEFRDKLEELMTWDKYNNPIAHGALSEAAWELQQAGGSIWELQEHLINKGLPCKMD